MIGIGIGIGFPQFTAAASSGGGPVAPQNVQATPQDRNILLTWDADDNVEYIVYANAVDDFNTASYISAIAAPSTGNNCATTDNLDPVPFTNQFTTGSKYYFWVVGGDGAGNPITDPSNSAAGRAFVTLAALATASLYTPDGATLTWGTVLFSSAPIPANLEMTLGGTTAVYDAGINAWFDIHTFSEVTNDPFSGAFSVNNLSGFSFTFWDTEP